MSDLGAIHRCGVHIPRLRLPRSVIAAAMSWASPPGRIDPGGNRAVGNWDEDALTMGIEAARSCLATTGGGVIPLVDALMLCSTTLPFAERDHAVMLRAALDLPDTVDALNLGTTLRAGTTGLLHALEHGGRSLVVASDMRLSRAGSAEELSYGDAAAAFLLGPSTDACIARALAVRRVGADFVDHYRMAGSRFGYCLEERWVRDESLLKIVPTEVSGLLAAAGVKAADIRHFVVPASRGTAKRIAEAAGLAAARRAERSLTGCGDAGTALPLLLLAESLESAQPGDLIVILGLGQGVDSLLLRAEAGARCHGLPVRTALDAGREEAHYMRYMSHRGLVEVDFGMRAERDQRTAHSVAYRKRDALSAFKGGRCTACGSVQFPQSRACVNPECRATDTQTAYRLADSRGRVKSFTEDWQAFAARPPYLYGNVEFDAGGNLLMEFTDAEPGDLAVGREVRFVYRIKDEDRLRAFRRYFWKATPA